jgi:hypothetical protein
VAASADHQCKCRAPQPAEGAQTPAATPFLRPPPAQVPARGLQRRVLTLPKPSTAGLSPQAPDATFKGSLQCLPPEIGGVQPSCEELGTVGQSAFKAVSSKELQRLPTGFVTNELDTKNEYVLRQRMAWAHK